MSSREKDWLMVREDWYSHLASTNLRIAEARRRIENQKAHIRSSIEGGHSAHGAIVLLRLLEETLELMNSRRTNILKKVRAYRLPVCDQHGLYCLCDSPEPAHGVYFKLTS